MMIITEVVPLARRNLDGFVGILGVVLFFLMLSGCQNSRPVVDEVGSVGQTKAEVSDGLLIKEDFAVFKEDFLESFWQQIPDWGIYVGRYEFASQLRVPNNDYYREFSQFLSRQRALLDSFPIESLDDNDAADWKIIQRRLDGFLWMNTVFKEHQWNPSQYNVARIIGLLLNTDYAPMEDRLADINQRLEKVPAYYQAGFNQLTTPTLEHTQLAIQQNQGTLGLLQERVAEAIANSQLTVDDKQAFEKSVTSAALAVSTYIDRLQRWIPKLEDGQGKSFRIGESLYEKKFSLNITQNYSAKEIYQLALAEKQRLHKEMLALSKTLWVKYYGDEVFPDDKFSGIQRVLEKVSLDHVHRDEFVASVQTQIPKLEAFVREKDLIFMDPKKPLVVRPTPEYQRGIAGASIEAPGPYDKKANTYYNVTPLDAYTDEQAQSYLREYNSYTLQILNIHEAVPGHYTQLVHSNQSPSLIKAIFGNGAMIEGWAVYTERMMLEEGYGDNLPELWLMYYKWNLRVVVNTVLDYSVQVLGMEKEQAMELLVKEAFQEKTEAQGKWRRATLTQVQLTSYFTGYQAIYEFRELVRAQQGEDFDLKKFHNQFLSYGSAPVDVIKSLMISEL